MQDIVQQAKILIGNSQKILIFPSSNLRGDNLGSALGLFFTLRNLGKNANLAIKRIPQKLHFLTEELTPSFLLEPSNQYFISIKTLGKEISEIRYEKNEKDLKIYFTLRRGKIEDKDISFSPLSFEKPDLLITLGIQSREELGEWAEKKVKLFYETPVLNIDNQLTNEKFGQVNLIEITSLSLGEILTNLIKTLEEAEGRDLFNPQVATCLLTGIVEKSQNFRNSKTQPQTFETASFLIQKGANHQKIIQHLYRKKSIAQINLLGRILEKLEFEEEKELYSVSLKEEDFQKSQTYPRDLAPIIEELKFNFKYLSNLLILWRSKASPPIIRGILYSPKLSFIERIQENFPGEAKGEGVIFSIPEKNLISAKEKVLKILS